MPNKEAAPSRDTFELAIFCALQSEGEAVLKLFDPLRTWTGRELDISKEENTCVYDAGCIGDTYVVLVWMGDKGKSKAVSAAAHLRSDFKNIKDALVVGICGGVPHKHKEKEIILGDVIISTRLQKYDEGKQYPDEHESGAVYEPSNIQAFLDKISSSHNTERLQNRCATILHELQPRLQAENAFTQVGYPGGYEDILYKAEYVHKHRETSDCATCAYSSGNCQSSRDLDCAELKCSQDQSNIVPRSRFQTQGRNTDPWIHFGAIGSGDTVWKSGFHRDVKAEEVKVIGFEMEGAGVCEEKFDSVVVIKAVCDYADSHKNKKWQLYAAIAAAACCKAFLEFKEEQFRSHNVEDPPTSQQGPDKQPELVDRSSNSPKSGPLDHPNQKTPSLPMPTRIAPHSSQADPGLEGGSLSGSAKALPLDTSSNGAIRIGAKSAGEDSQREPRKDIAVRPKGVPKKSAEEAAGLIKDTLDQSNARSLENILQDPAFDITAKNKYQKGIIHLVIGTRDVSADRDRMQKIAEAIELLNQRGANINATDENGRTPLHWCAKTMNRIAARWLIAHGVNVNAEDSEGRTPLFCAGSDNKPDLKFLQELTGNGGTLMGKFDSLPSLPETFGQTQVEARKLLRRYG